MRNVEFLRVAFKGDGVTGLDIFNELKTMKGSSRMGEVIHDFDSNLEFMSKTVIDLPNGKRVMRYGVKKGKKNLFKAHLKNTHGIKI